MANRSAFQQKASGSGAQRGALKSPGAAGLMVTEESDRKKDSTDNEQPEVDSQADWMKYLGQVERDMNKAVDSEDRTDMAAFSRATVIEVSKGKETLRPPAAKVSLMIQRLVREDSTLGTDVVADGINQGCVRGPQSRTNRGSDSKAVRDGGSALSKPVKAASKGRK